MCHDPRTRRQRGDVLTYRELQARIDEQRKRKEFPPTEWGVGEISAERYTSEEWYRRETARVFNGPVWLLACHIEKIANPGDAFVADVGSGGTIIVLRDKAGDVRAFRNACRHRGTELLAASGNVKSLKCPYHSWLYSLDGKLLSVPDEPQFCGLEKESRGLFAVRAGTFAGYVWATLDDAAPALEEYVADLVPQFAPYKLEDMTVIDEETWEFPVNWKVIVDAFNEIYHVPGLHPQTVEPFLDCPAAVMDAFGHHTRMVLPFLFPDSVMKPPDVAALPVAPAPDLDPVQRNADYHFTVFPNAQFNLLPNYATLFVTTPLGADRCRFLYAFHGYKPKNDEQRTYYRNLSAAFRIPLHEDFDNFPKVQRGIAANAKAGFVLNYQERRIRHFHHVLGEMCQG